MQKKPKGWINSSGINVLHLFTAPLLLYPSKTATVHLWAHWIWSCITWVHSNMSSKLTSWSSTFHSFLIVNKCHEKTKTRTMNSMFRHHNYKHTAPQVYICGRDKWFSTNRLLKLESIERWTYTLFWSFEGIYWQKKNVEYRQPNDLNAYYDRTEPL